MTQYGYVDLELQGDHRRRTPSPEVASKLSDSVSPDSMATLSLAGGGPALQHSPTQEDMSLGNERDSSCGPQRSKYNAATPPESIKEKRKRSRVTSEQLSQLETIFATDRNPNAARRREISDLLGMQERQTQIWFQNRRAKAKLQDCKPSQLQTLEPPPDTPPELSAGFQMDLHNLIHENEPVTIIPCTELTIGAWRRIASTITKYDLVAYVSDSKRCLTWYIQSGGYGFKMVLPFESIVGTEFQNASPACGTATFTLSEPPLFFAENISPSSAANSVRTWKRCGDWTEARQATLVLQHTLVGSAVQLSHVLQNLQRNVAVHSSRHSPLYRNEAAQNISGMRVRSVSARVSSPGGSCSDGELGSSHSDISGTSHQRRSSYNPYYSSSPGIYAPANAISSIVHYPPSQTTTGSSTSFHYSPDPRLYPLSLASRLNCSKPTDYMNLRSPVAYGHHLSLSLPSTPVLTTPHYPPGNMIEFSNADHLEDGHSPPILSGSGVESSMNIHDTNRGQIYR